MKNKLKLKNSCSVFFLMVFALLFFLGQLQRIEIKNCPSFYLHDVWLSMWLLLILSKHRLKLKQVFRDKIKKMEVNGELKYLKFVFIWIIIGWLLEMIFGNLSFRALLYSLRFIVYGTLLFSINQLQLLSKKILKWLFYSTGLFTLFFGFIQYALLPDVRFLEVFGWDDHYFRMVGTQFDPNFLGILFIILFFFLYLDRKFSNNIFKKLVLILITAGVAFTFSRATYLSFFMGIFLVSQKQKLPLKKIMTYAYILFLVVFVILAPKPGGEGVNLARTSSIDSRVSSSAVEVNQFDSYQLVTGKGLFNVTKENLAVAYGGENHAGLADNILLFTFNSLGVVGAVVFLYWVGKKLFKLKTNDPHAFLLIALVLLHSLFNNTLFQPFVFLYLGWGLISLDEIKVKSQT